MMRILFCQVVVLLLMIAAARASTRSCMIRTAELLKWVQGDAPEPVARSLSIPYCSLCRLTADGNQGKVGTHKYRFVVKVERSCRLRPSLDCEWRTAAFISIIPPWHHFLSSLSSLTPAELDWCWAFLTSHVFILLLVVVSVRAFICL